MKAELTHDEYLTAKGLFHLAQEHARKSQEYEAALARLLKSEDENYAGCVSDAIYEDGGTLEDGLEKHGVTVAAPSEKDTTE